MLRIVQQNRPFFLAFCYWLIVGALLQIFFSQNDIILWVNRHHSLSLDMIFKYGTHLGDGITYGIFIILLFILKERQTGYIALSSFLMVAGVFSYCLKELLRTPRPITVFVNNLASIHLVDNVVIAEWFSFPSGHTLSAFSQFLLLSFISKNKKWGYFYVFLAVFVAYSRLYLFQHFALDVYAGSIFGVGFTMLISYFFRHTK